MRGKIPFQLLELRFAQNAVFNSLRHKDIFLNIQNNCPESQKKQVAPNTPFQMPGSGLIAADKSDYF